MDVKQIVFKAKAASLIMGSLNSVIKNRALMRIKESLNQHYIEIYEANTRDRERALKENLSQPLVKRLKFDNSKNTEVCAGIETLIRLEDPIGKTLWAKELDQGLELYKVSCPIGVIGVIFESRPDALIQISTLCLKSGNAVILKGGTEALETNQVLTRIIADASISEGLPEGWIQLLETRQDVASLLCLDTGIDLLIPRGSNQFVRYIMDHTHIPVLGHAEGICHVYVDKDAIIDMATKIVVDSKCQYPAVCNAMETLLVHEAIARDFLKKVQVALEDKNVELRGCEKTRKFINIKPASQEDWSTEYLDLILSIKTVASVEEAIDHINTYSSGHTDSIVTENKETAIQFLNKVDSADVFWNASTRFSDGYRYGLGAEVGISTNKIHARGPVGLEGLVIYKWKLMGKGHIVADYTGPDARKFTHKDLI